MRLSTFLTAVVAGTAVSVALPQSSDVSSDSSRLLPGFPGFNFPKPLVSSIVLRNLITRRDLSSKAQTLQRFADASPGRNRVFGSPGHNATVNWLYDELVKLDAYDVYLQPFTETYAENSAKVTVDAVDQGAGPFTYAPGGQVTEQLVQVANVGCAASDFPAAVSGKIALISRGTCPFASKVGLAGAAGAKAALIYNNADGALSGTLGGTSTPEGPYVPVASLDKARGDALVGRLAAGETVTAALDIVGITEDRETYNVIAQTRTGDPNEVYFVGSHTDSVIAGPGINDNGSGTISLLTIAQKLKNFRTNKAIRFGFWSAEEFGLLGAEHYVRTLSTEERNKIRVYGNFDMVASPNYVYGVYDGSGRAFNITGPAGSTEGQDLLQSYFRSQRLNTVPSGFDGRSDYGPFLEANIACLGLFTGAEELKTEEEARLFGGQAGVALDANYHKAGDDINNLNYDAFLANAKAIAHTIATYGRGFQSLPPKEQAVPQPQLRIANAQHAHKGSIKRCGETLLEA
ncbi:aminopeptidase [Ceraceosorus bombacis]|uniref:Peptide hydrolase n=1 Tax=Ceraceosorus bombacis TaxID=401625 RepID=A0A0N7L932_9BASI|nr:aminopeptidase [Ceraceosorus bombacis]